MTPQKVESLTHHIVVEMTCGCYHACVITSTGAVYTWGCSAATGHGWGSIVAPKLLEGELSSKGVIYLSAHYDRTACITKTGEIYSWGNGFYGRLGHDNYSDQGAPKRIDGAPLIGVLAKMVSCGNYHTAVCTETGQVYTFGRGKFGELGHGEKKTSPALVVALEGKVITQVQCGKYHTMALTTTGYVFAWGSRRMNVQSDNVELIPYLVESLCDHHVVQITSKHRHCAVLVDPNTSVIRQSQVAAFNNKSKSDVVFMVENEHLYGNMGILSQNCEYFAAMFGSNWRESVEKVVKIQNCSKLMFLRVLEYLCLDGFAISVHDNVVELWDLAEMYLLEGLKYYCISALERGLCDENVSEILREAVDSSCSCDELKRMCRDYFERRKNESDK